MNKPELLRFTGSRGEHLATLFRSECSPISGTIIYIHGGGFIFGTSDDLPADMIEAFNHWGYHVLALTYPLAPEVTLFTIIETVIDAYTGWLSQQSAWIGSDFKGQLYIMGRSAGAYLAQALTASLIRNRQSLPNGFILFYGYSHFDQPDFINPSRFYLSYPKLTALDVIPLLKIKQLSSRPMKRIPLYVYARQQGKWLELLGITSSALPKLDLRPLIPEFPRTFLAAAIHDPDVPYENALDYHLHHPSSHLFTAQGNDHDFDQRDRSQRNTLLAELYAWLKA